MTALERAARTIDPQAWADDVYWPSHSRTWRRDMSMHSARAALLSLREPDEAMLEAMGNAGLDASEKRDVEIAIYQAAIDTILAEPTRETR